MQANIGLKKSQRQDVAQILERVLSDEYVLLAKTQNYHWNVRGHHFYHLHEFFEEQYKELIQITDEVAERIRSLGELSPGSLETFLKLTTLKEEAGDFPHYEKMLANLLADHESLVRKLREDLDICADQYGDMGTSDFLTALMEKHEKMAWMLRAHLE